jgi:DNA-binding transcriptional MocR family regulator
MTREDLEAIAEVLRETDILVISDEIYAELTYERKHTSITNIPGYERTYHPDKRIFKGICHDGMAFGLCCRTCRI